MKTVSVDVYEVVSLKYEWECPGCNKRAITTGPKVNHAHSAERKP